MRIQLALVSVVTAIFITPSALDKACHRARCDGLLASPTPPPVAIFSSPSRTANLAIATPSNQQEKATPALSNPLSAAKRPHRITKRLSWMLKKPPFHEPMGIKLRQQAPKKKSRPSLHKAPSHANQYDSDVGKIRRFFCQQDQKNKHCRVVSSKVIAKAQRQHVTMNPRPYAAGKPPQKNHIYKPTIRTLA